MPETTRQVEFTISVKLPHFNERDQRLLECAVAAFSDILPCAVRSAFSQEGGTKATLELPAQSAVWLLSAHRRRSPELLEYLNPEVFIDLREQELADFASVLEHRAGYWVIALAGSGGIGKTRLLQQMVALSQARGAAHSGLIDFYYTGLQTETGLLGAIGKRLGFEHFPQLFESLERCGTGPAAVNVEMLDIAVDHFISGLRELAAGRMVVVFLDTFERATETGVGDWFLEKVLPRMHESASVVLAGRNAFRSVDGVSRATGALGYREATIPVPPSEVHLVTLPSFSLSEVHRYVREYLIRRNRVDSPLQVDLGQYADLDIPPPEVQTIWEKSQGHPMIVALAADWLAEWGIGPITDVKDLPPEQFKQAMVRRVLDLSTPEDQAVLRIAHVYHRFDAEILAASYPELKKDGFDPEQVIQRLRRFSFVKYWLETGRCLLHDEMQRLVERYVWDEIDPVKDVRREISTEVVRYYDQALDREPDERARWVLGAERMYHRLFSDLKQGRPEFWRTADDAWTQYKLDFVAMLLSKGEEVSAKLKDPFLDVVNRVMRTRVNLEEWHLEEARELAHSVLDHPACTQRTRAAALAALGVYADRKGDGDLAIKRYQEALELYRDLEERLVQGEALPAEHGIPRLKGVHTEVAMLLNSVGIVQRHKGLFDAAITSYNQAREVARQEGDLEWLAAALNNIGNVERLRGNLSLARNLCEQALRYRERLQREHPGAAYLRDIGLSHNTLGMVLRDMQEHDLAQERFMQAKGIFEQLHDRSGVARASRNVGWVCYVKGKTVQDKTKRRRWFEKALRHYERSHQVCEEFRIEPELPNLLNRMAIVYRALGKTEKARETFARSMELARAQNDNLFIASNLVRLAEMAYSAGDLDQVAAYADELKRQFQEQGFRFGLAYAEMEELLAQVALDAGEYEEAFRHLGENYAHLTRLNRWRLDRKINVLREFFEQLPNAQWRRRCGEQLIQFWEKQGLAERYADLTTICEEYIIQYGA